jgi:isohexenylglutaconyl-CoA hydratase
VPEKREVIPFLNADPALIQAARLGAFWFVRLHRPEKFNSLSAQMIELLQRACEQIQADSAARAVVLWGAGAHFCAGADLQHFLELLEGGLPIASTDPQEAAAPEQTDPVARYNRQFGRLLESLADLHCPTMAVVRGSAIGGGCGLASVCDRVIAVDGATFSMPETRIGATPAQITPFVIRRVGRPAGRWLLTNGSPLSAQEAVAVGLADMSCSESQIEQVVRGFLEKLGKTQPQALHETLRLIRDCDQSTLSATLDTAAGSFGRLLRLGHAHEGIGAARGRRAAKWQVEVPALPEFT